MLEGCDSGNLEGCCVDVVVDESWKLMMIYVEREEHAIYTVLRLGTPAALKV